MKRFIFTLACIISVVIGLAAGLYAGTINGMPIVGIALGIIYALIIIISAIRERYEKYCGRCKTKYDINDPYQVDYRPIASRISADDSGAMKNYTFRFKCTCPKCNKTKVYKKKILGASLSGNKLSTYDPDDYIERDFTKESGIGAAIIVIISTLIISGLMFLAVPLLGYAGNMISYLYGDSIENVVDQLQNGDDSYADPKDYYGEYYIHTPGLILKANITENECLLNCDYLIQADETITCEYEYIPAEHVGENMFITPTGKDALIIYTSANKISDYIVLWVMDKNDGVYQFQTATGLDVSNTPITFEDLINDPKNYFGNYIHSNYYLTLNEDGTAIADIGNGTQNFKFAYCPSEVTCEVVDSGRAIEAIILYSESSDSIYVFEIKDTSTLILNEWEFVDEEAAGAMGLVDPKDYFGKYYYHNGSRIVCIDIQDTTCTVIHDNLITSDETINCTYRFIPAKYVSEELSEIAYPDCAAIFVYTDSVTKDGFTLWVTAKSDGNYTFTTSDGHIATTTPLTFADVTNDPQNYYGTFSYANLYVTLKEDGTAVADLGEGAVNYSFVYVDAALANKIFSNGSYGNSILLYIENTNSLYVFNVKNTNTLVLNDTYEFTK